MTEAQDQPIVDLESIASEAQEEQPAQVSRRAFLSGTLAGGAAGLAVAAGTGLGVYQVADARAKEALAAAEQEMARLQGLVELYERLERIGLDGILQTGMVAVVAPLEVVQRGAEALKKGLELIEEAVVSLREALPSALEAFTWLRGRIDALADGIQLLHSAVDRLLDRVTDNPVADKLAEALAWVLDRLPFEWGEKVRGAFTRLVELIGGADDLVRDANSRLLEPVEKKWFSSDGSPGLGSTFLDPLVQRVLDPLEAHLGELAALVQVWQTKLMAPAQKALEERGTVRAEIADYRARHGLPR